MCALPALWCGSTTEWGQQSLRVVISCEGQKALAPKAVSEQRKGNNCGHLKEQLI